MPVQSSKRQKKSTKIPLTLSGGDHLLLCMGPALECA